MVMGTKEGFVVTGIGDDDIGISCLGGCGKEPGAELIESDAVFGLEGFSLVLDANDGLVVADRNVRVGDTGLGHHQDDGGTLGCCEGVVDAHLFYLVRSVSNASGVDESEGDATQLNGVFDGITGSTLYVADDSTLLTYKCIEEG